jgi:hypothetical protein
MLLTSTQVARLVARPRFWGTRAFKRGQFGPVICGKGRALFVELAAVQRSLGVTFTPEQLRAAGVWVPEREGA